MEVFFCDLCGARVTDTDLSAGQGQRKGFDVICGACIHAGQGQSWSKARDERRSQASERIAAARDRAATIEDDRVRPPTSIVVAESEPEVVTTRVEPTQGLADMAGGMAALAAAPAPAPINELVEVDDLDEGPAMGGNEASRSTVATAPVQNPAPRPAKAPGASSGRIAKPGTSAQPKSGRTSSKQSKASSTTRATAKTSSAKRKAAPIGTGQYVLFGIAIVGLVVVGVLTVTQLNKKPVDMTPRVEKDDALKGMEALKAAIQEANAVAREALGTRPYNKAALERAKGLAQQAYDRALRFQDDAIRSWTAQGLAEEDAANRVGTSLRHAGFYDCQGNLKAVKDALMIAK
ncbi:MAG: hypothetical protein RLZZ127_2167 [Planctomycetota bacterium]|jgi:hypothetical protein